MGPLKQFQRTVDKLVGGNATVEHKDRASQSSLPPWLKKKHQNKDQRFVVCKHTQEPWLVPQIVFKKIKKSIEDSLTATMIPHYSWFGAMKVYQLVNLASIRVSQAELRQRLMQLPKYLRVAIRHCILRKDASLSSDGTLMQLEYFDWMPSDEIEDHTRMSHWPGVIFVFISLWIMEGELPPSTNGYEGVFYIYLV